MLAEIISIGDELLIGQTINTNAAWIGQKLALLGFKINHVATIPDQEDAIVDAIKQAMERSKLLVVTGGLGPTKDDITKKVIANYFEDELVLNQQVLEHVKQFFIKRNAPMLEVNIHQAMVPKSCEVLFNEIGTAPGMWIDKNESVLISLPGVPYEMKNIMEQVALPKIENYFQGRKSYFKTANIIGIGETSIADKMQDWEIAIRNHGLELAYLPSPGYIRLRISSSRGEEDEALIDAYFKELENNYSKNFVAYGDVSIQEVVGNLLNKHQATLGTAESCTGGAIASSLVSVPGSSSYFIGSMICYSNELKINLLHVNPKTIEKFGAVSEAVVREMAINCKSTLNVDYAISISGIAGPSGGTVEKPVGTVWIGLASPKCVIAKKFNFTDNRERIIQRSVLSSLNILKNELLASN